jgi:hypothetical protein
MSEKELGEPKSVKADKVMKSGESNEGGTKELSGTTVYFKAGDSDEKLVVWDSAGANIVFDLQSFREIDDEVLDRLSRKVQRDYDRAIGALQAMNVKPKHEVFLAEPYDLNGTVSYQFSEEPGWHNTLIRAADKDKFEKLGYEVVKTAETKEGKAVMIEMRIDEGRYRATLHNDSRKSEAQLKGTADRLKDKVHEVRDKVRVIEED